MKKEVGKESVQNWAVLEKSTIELSKLAPHEQEAYAASLLTQAFRAAGYCPKLPDT